jgi:hypothetical protein
VAVGLINMVKLKIESSPTERWSSLKELSQLCGEESGVLVWHPFHSDQLNFGKRIGSEGWA